MDQDNKAEDKAMAEYDAAHDALTGPGRLLKIMRTMDLAQIGYILLSTVGEAEHGNWDGHEIQNLPKLQYAYEDLAGCFEIMATEPMPAYDWGFGGPEFWDPSGKRRLRKV